MWAAKGCRFAAAGGIALLIACDAREAAEVTAPVTSAADVALMPTVIVGTATGPVTTHVADPEGPRLSVGQTVTADFLPMASTFKLFKSMQTDTAIGGLSSCDWSYVQSSEGFATAAGWVGRVRIARLLFGRASLRATFNHERIENSHNLNLALVCASEDATYSIRTAVPSGRLRRLAESPKALNAEAGPGFVTSVTEGRRFVLLFTVSNTSTSEKSSFVASAGAKIGVGFTRLSLSGQHFQQLQAWAQDERVIASWYMTTADGFAESVAEVGNVISLAGETLELNTQFTEAVARLAARAAQPVPIRYVVSSWPFPGVKPLKAFPLNYDQLYWTLEAADECVRTIDGYRQRAAGGAEVGFEFVDSTTWATWSNALSGCRTALAAGLAEALRCRKKLLCEDVPLPRWPRFENVPLYVRRLGLTWKMDVNPRDRPMPPTAKILLIARLDGREIARGSAMLSSTDGGTAYVVLPARLNLREIQRRLTLETAVRFPKSSQELRWQGTTWLSLYGNVHGDGTGVCYRMVYPASVGVETWQNHNPPMPEGGWFRMNGVPHYEVAPESCRVY